MSKRNLGLPIRSFFILEVAFTFACAYLGAIAFLTLLSKGLDSRILFTLEPYYTFTLVPHAFKILLWSIAGVFVFRRNFGWLFPFVLLMAYGSAEAFSSTVFLLVHEPFNPSYYLIWFPPNSVYYGEFLSFITIGLIGYWVVRPRFRFDWALLPFAVFVIGWALMGYNTEVSTFATYQQEVFEFIWNVVYLLAASQVIIKR